MVSWDKMLVDAMTMRMVAKPASIDTVVATDSLTTLCIQGRKKYRGVPSIRDGKKAIRMWLKSNPNGCDKQATQPI